MSHNPFQEVLIYADGVISLSLLVILLRLFVSGAIVTRASVEEIISKVVKEVLNEIDYDHRR